MTELMTHDRTAAKPKSKHGNGTAPAPVLVSGYKLAVHFGITRQRVDHLAAQGVIERCSDGKFDQDRSRLKYFDHLRAEHKRSPRSEVDTLFTKAKAELIQLRIQERKRILVNAEEVFAQIDEMVGLFLSGLSSFAARIGGRDMAARRVIDQEVYNLRVEISQAATALADKYGEPPEDAA